MPMLARGDDGVDWKKDAAFRQQLSLPVGIAWGDNPLRPALDRLARSQQVAMLLDRRVDPDQRVEFTSRDESLELALARLCQQLELGRAVVGSVVYLGPRDTADRLATVAAMRRKDAGNLPAAGKARWLKQQPLAWPELSTPREIIDRLAAEGRFKVEGTVPHDVWPAADFPSLPLTDRLSLVLAGFGLTYTMEQNGAVARLSPLPEAVEYAKSYTRSDPAKLAAELKRVLPQLDIQRKGDEVVVVARHEDHETIDRLLRGEKVRTVTPKGSEKLYSLRVENQSAGAVVKRIAQELGKELKYDEAALARLREKVSFTVQEVSLDSLLKTTLEPLGLKGTVTDESLEITVAGE